MSDARRRCIGAMIGWILGAITFWIARHWSTILLAAIGAGLAVGAGWPAARRSMAWGLAVGIAAPAAALATAWCLGVPPKYLASSHAITSLSVVAGLGFYFGMGRNKRPPVDSRSNTTQQPTSAPEGARG